MFSWHPTPPIEHVRILVAEDHPYFQQFVEGLLEPPFEIVGKVQDGRGLLEAAANLKPDVILANIEIPIFNGPDAVRELTKSGCHAKVIFLTIESGLDFVREGLAVGSFGYVVKAQGDAMIDLRCVTRMLFGAGAGGTRCVGEADVRTHVRTSICTADLQR